jgi:hypothetical protein
MSETTQTDGELPPLPEDAPLPPSEIVGEHTFSGRLYSQQKAKENCPVNVLSGEQTHKIPSADAIEEWVRQKNAESRQKAETEEWHSHTDHVALVAASTEMAAESGSLISRAAWFHFDITGSMEMHNTLRLAAESDNYAVVWEADYEAGELTVAIEPVAGGA